MNDQVVTIVVAVLSSTAISAIIVKLFERDKQKADVKSAGVHDDVNIGELGLKYAQEFKEEINKLKSLNKELETENKRLASLIDGLEERVQQLTDENIFLRKEIQQLKDKS